MESSTMPARPLTDHRAKRLHAVGVVCGLAAGAWLGGAEVPAKLANAALSPFAVSFCMVAGVFVARWTVPALLKGGSSIVADLRETRHLLVWGILAGALWSVANTLTIYAIRDIGLAIAFPLWNTNCLVGLFWGWLLFHELKGASAANKWKVVGGTVAILMAAAMLAYSSMYGSLVTTGHARQGVIAALGAALLWGTMYVPYRKAYLSGMNPLSFVTVFTVGEVGSMLLLAATVGGGVRPLLLQLSAARAAIFWLFLGGFCWVLGDLFQQYATRFIGIGRAIPLSNTNQLWGLAWGALVFGELAAMSAVHHLLVIAGSVVMLLGALAISTSCANAQEQAATHRAITRECDRYRLDQDRVLHAQTGTAETCDAAGRGVADYLIAAVATAIFVALAWMAAWPTVSMRMGWTVALLLLLVGTLAGAGWWLWKETRFQ